jgi:uncharacterized surface protein with fasciclin (FAS1) repeats
MFVLNILNKIIMRKKITLSKLGKPTLIFPMLLISIGLQAQTNVFDDVIAPSPNHTYLEAALVQEGLDVVLQNNAADLTVFAPDDNAFTSLATALGTDINGLLALPNLTDILTYHVLGTTVVSSGITNGAIVQPVSTTNTLKLTLTSTGSVFVNQAQVTTANLSTDNGVVHVLNAVVLPYETVVDVAIDNGFTSLTSAVVKAELLPALTNPLTKLTVFAPTNTAFDNLATALGTDLTGVLAHPQLADILLYHVIGDEVLSSELTNGSVATLNGQNVTINLTGGVKVNNSNVTLPDLTVSNGVVHVIDAVLVPSLASIDENILSELTIYPNPTVDYLILKNATVSSYKVMNTAGVTVLSGDVNGNKIDVHNLENGNYFIQLNGENTLQTVRFSKM